MTPSRFRIGIEQHILGNQGKSGRFVYHADMASPVEPDGHKLGKQSSRRISSKVHHFFRHSK